MLLLRRELLQLLLLLLRRTALLQCKMSALELLLLLWGTFCCCCCFHRRSRGIAHEVLLVAAGYELSNKCVVRQILLQSFDLLRGSPSEHLHPDTPYFRRVFVARLCCFFL